LKEIFNYHKKFANKQKYNAVQQPDEQLKVEKKKKIGRNRKKRRERENVTTDRFGCSSAVELRPAHDATHSILKKKKKKKRRKKNQIWVQTTKGRERERERECYPWIG
jgi:hypothetical protein